MKTGFLAAITLLFCLCTFGGCQTPAQKRKEAARLDSLKQDSAKAALNAYNTRQDRKISNLERENLGNLDSLVTPQQPVIPNH